MIQLTVPTPMFNGYAGLVDYLDREGVNGTIEGRSYPRTRDFQVTARLTVPARRMQRDMTMGVSMVPIVIQRVIAEREVEREVDNEIAIPWFIEAHRRDIIKVVYGIKIGAIQDDQEQSWMPHQLKALDEILRGNAPAETARDDEWRARSLESVRRNGMPIDTAWDMAACDAGDYTATREWISQNFRWNYSG